MMFLWKRIERKKRAKEAEQAVDALGYKILCTQIKFTGQFMRLFHLWSESERLYYYPFIAFSKLIVSRAEEFNNLQSMYHEIKYKMNSLKIERGLPTIDNSEDILKTTRMIEKGIERILLPPNEIEDVFMLLKLISKIRR